MKKPKIIVILGQTASGKSDLAVKIARRCNGEIISADSRQVYKGLDIGSGKVPRDNSKIKSPTPTGRQEKSKLQIKNQNYFYKKIQHHLLDVASPKRTFTVAQYQKLAKKEIKKILTRGKIPIICGGTGLYIDSIIYNTKFPEVPPRPKLRKKLEKFSTEELFQKLQKLDPRRAENIDKHNRRRLIRALEIVLTTKSPVPPFSAAADYDILLIGIKKSPEKLKKLIAERLEKRLKIGMIKEVENLHKNGVSWKRLDDLGLEYRYVSRYLRGLIDKPRSKTNLQDRQEMIEILNKEINKYAKRQMTWFSAKGGSALSGKKNQLIHWVFNDKQAGNLTNKFLKSKIKE